MGATGATHSHALGLPERYQPLRWLANGGMAAVWSARDRLLSRRVAIKLLSEGVVNDDRAVRRFKREARAAARLSGHPHVVAIYDVGETSAGRPFMVMEHLPGGTVADALRAGPVDRELALQWIRDAAAALDHAHERGIVHRDVKPGNLLLGEDRTLHVADFGIASLSSEQTLTDTGHVLGTAAYLSPEQALGQGATDASDRYSLAVVAYELLVGVRPFNAEPATALARQHVEQTAPRASRRNRTLPRAVDDVLDRGLAKQPHERWATASAFADALERACRPAVMPAALRVSAVPAGSPARGRAAALGALAAAALVVGVATGASDDGSHARAGAFVPRAPAVRTATHHRRAHRHAPAQTATSPAQTTAPPTADTLEAQGHALMESGDYAGAIPVLRAAVNAADPASVTYAYALFDLGRSLRLNGDPQAAIPILYRRLQIPIETNVVRQELQLALQAMGARYSGDHHGHGHGPKGQGPPGQGGGDGGD